MLPAQSLLLPCAGGKVAASRCLLAEADWALHVAACLPLWLVASRWTVQLLLLVSAALRLACLASSLVSDSYSSQTVLFRWLASERVPPPQCCRLPTRAHLVRYGMSFDLDDSQHEAWERFLEGKNVGLFGRAGCGTSTVLLRAIAHAQRLHGSEHVVVLAWTNHAANLISGQTLHKFLRVGIADVPKEVVLEQVRSNTFVRDHVKAAKVIFVDELPQFPARWFAVLEFVVRQLAPASRQALPWGGTQVVGELVVAWFSTLCLGQ